MNGILEEYGLLIFVADLFKCNFCNHLIISPFMLVLWYPGHFLRAFVTIGSSIFSLKIIFFKVLQGRWLRFRLLMFFRGGNIRTDFEGISNLYFLQLRILKMGDNFSLPSRRSFARHAMRKGRVTKPWERLRAAPVALECFWRSMTNCHANQ